MLDKADARVAVLCRIPSNDNKDLIWNACYTNNMTEWKTQITRCQMNK